MNATHVFPIPTRGILNVENDKYVILEARLFDTTGRVVESPSLHGGQIDLSHLASGTYLLQITTEVGSLTRKIVVE
jgi:hypothetical protein